MTDLKVIFDQRKLNNAASKIEIPKAFIDKFPDLSITRREKYFNKYVEAVAKAVVRSLPWIQDDGIIAVSTEALFNECGDFKYKNERFYVWKELKDIYPFFHITDTGSNLKSGAGYNKNSQAKINERMVAMMLEERTPESVFNELFDNADLSHPDVEIIDIDMDNLKNFIDGTEYALNKATDAAHRNKLQKSLYQAQLIYKVGLYSEAETTRPILPMIPSPSVYGRTYYKGVNIQNVTKEVRSAVIGPHFQYDMNAAVYAIKLALYNDIKDENNLVNTLDATYTRQYLDEKTAIRKRLATTCFAGVALPDETKIKAIKNALTAIGFGAKTHGGAWFDGQQMKGPAISEIITNQLARETFMNDPWVSNFIDEQKVIEDAILANMQTWETFEEIKDALKDTNKANGRVSKAMLLAYVYQQAETNMMNIAVDILKKYGIKVVARIHDAFIVTKRVPVKVLDEIAGEWSYSSSHTTLDCEEFREWIPVELRIALAERENNIALHKQHLEHEQQIARMVAIKRGGVA